MNVYLNFGAEDIPVGRLAIKNRLVYFEYDTEFLQSGLEISPFKLPLQLGLSSFENKLFDGLPGVFNDSLPDGWGRLVLDRLLRSQGIAVGSLTVLDRLSYVGKRGMGALCYEPAAGDADVPGDVDLDHINKEVQLIISGDSQEVFKELINLNGSSAGARPKVLVGINKERTQIIFGADKPDYEHWLVKFANANDGLSAGAVEYVYSLLAKTAGLHMTDTHLFPAKQGCGYFAIKRFDRAGVNRLHMHTVAGILHADYRIPALDYSDLIKLTWLLTKDSRDVEMMYRIAVYNVLAHNRDDHARNFAFLMGSDGIWRLAPAYDLTYSNGPGGEQSTMVMGVGKNITQDDLIKLAKVANIKTKTAREIIEQTVATLSRWRRMAQEHGVERNMIKEIEKGMATIIGVNS